MEVKKGKKVARLNAETAKKPQEAPGSPQEKWQQVLGSLKGIQETATGLTP